MKGKILSTAVAVFRESLFSTAVAVFRDERVSERERERCGLDIG